MKNLHIFTTALVGFLGVSAIGILFNWWPGDSPGFIAIVILYGIFRSIECAVESRSTYEEKRSKKLHWVAVGYCVLASLFVTIGIFYFLWGDTLGKFLHDRNIWTVFLILAALLTYFFAIPPKKVTQKF